jgi:hypothetical protein
MISVNFNTIKVRMNPTIAQNIQFPVSIEGRVEVAEEAGITAAKKRMIANFIYGCG